MCDKNTICCVLQNVETCEKGVKRERKKPGNTGKIEKSFAKGLVEMCRTGHVETVALLVKKR